MALILLEGLRAPSQKTSLLGGVTQILIYSRPSPRLADVGLFVRPKSQHVGGIMCLLWRFELVDNISWRASQVMDLTLSGVAAFHKIFAAWSGSRVGCRIRHWEQTEKVATLPAFQVTWSGASGKVRWQRVKILQQPKPLVRSEKARDLHINNLLTLNS